MNMDGYQYYDDDDGESISSAGGGYDQPNALDAPDDDGLNNNGFAPTYLGGGHLPSEEKINFDDPRIASLPRILMMGPRRAGKTSIQRVVFHKMSPHETLFRLEATQMLERAVVDHTPLCRFTIWDFPGD